MSRSQIPAERKHSHSLPYKNLKGNGEKLSMNDDFKHD